MRFDVRLPILPILAALLLTTAGLVATDLISNRVEWDRRGLLQRGYAEIGELKDIFPRQDDSLSPTFEKFRLRFDMDRENNIPTWFTSSLLLTAGFLVLMTAIRTWQLRKRGFYSWMLIALALFYISMDEAAQIHEMLGGEGSVGYKLNQELGLDFVTFDWVVPAVILMLAALPMMIPFFWKLPRGTTALFVLAGGIYLGGALALETYQGNYIETHNIDSWGYHVLSVGEETMEMLGLIIFIGAVMLYWRDNLQDAPLVAEPPPAAAVEAREGSVEGAPAG